MKQDEIQLIKDVANIIVQICFDTNELVHLYDSDNLTSAKRIFQCHEDIKQGMDKIIGSENVKRMGKNVQESKEAVKNTLNIYKSIQLSFDNKTEIMVLLEKLQAHLSDLQLQLNKK
jgi:hypothetical protein